MTRLFVDRTDSPVGPLTLVHDEGGALCGLHFDRGEARLARAHRGAELAEAPAPASTRAALAAYFAGDHAALRGIPLAAAGTPFQQAVWSALRAIPPGTTLSYGALAARIGAPKAVRAVGLANGANPIAVVVPCHRVIGADGSLTGFGGGIERKRWLLAHEGVAVAGGRQRALF